MIGRKAELQILKKSYFDSMEDKTAKIVTIVGEAGVGK